MTRAPASSLALLVSSLLAAGACSAGGATGSSGASSSSSGTSSSGGGSAATTEAFGDCTHGLPADGGAGAPGTPCRTEADCKPACCLCPHGQTRYSYNACSGGRCASICDPTNDYRAPICVDGGEPVDGGCMHCAQILGEALADGDQLGSSACPGAATTAWSALGACVSTSCGTVCPGIMPTNECVQCIEATDADGGCATEIDGCLAN